MKKYLSCGFVFLFAIIILVSALSSLQVSAELEGEMDSEIWFSPGTATQLFSRNSLVSWKGDYTDGNIEDLPSRISEVLYWPATRLADTGLALSGKLKSGLVTEELFGISLDGYYAREFGPDYPIGTLGGSSRLSFSQDELEYWANKGIVNYAGFSYQGIFLLERGPQQTDAYNSGVEVSVSGTKLQGVTVELKALFGMVPNPRELVGNGDGSGYDTFTPAGKRINGYSESQMSFEGMKVGPVRLKSTSHFSAGKGFERTTLDFSLKEEAELLEFEGSINYTPSQKAISLNPGLDLEWACLELYTELLPEGLSEEKSELTGLSVKGYGISEVQLGDVRVSFLEALGDNFLYRDRGERDWRLRASDYTFPPSDEKLAFEETDYQGVFSLEGGLGNLYLGADAYWSEGGKLFGLGKFTGEAEYDISEFFELTAGLVLDAGSGLQNLILNTVYRW